MDVARRTIKRIWQSELGKGSIILLITLNLFNVLNFVFHFTAARLLTPAEYGVLATLLSLLLIFNLPSEAIRTVLSRYATKIQGEKGKLKDLYVKAIKKFGVAAFLTFIGYVVISPLIGYYLDIQLSLIILTGVIVFALYFIAVNQGVLRGIKRFTQLGISYIANGAGKLILAIALILVGWKVFGAIGGIVLGTMLASGVSFFYVRDIVSAKRERHANVGVYKYSIPVLVSTAVITLLFSIDILLAKRFFEDAIVGQYAAIANIGKIIVFGTQPVSKAMFPLSAEKHDEKQSTAGLLKKSLFYVGLLAGAAVIVYTLFPKLIIHILYGAQYVESAPLLMWVAVAMGLLALSNVYLFYNLATGKEDKNYIFLALLALEVLLLYMYHETLLQFIMAIVAANAIILVTLVLQSWRK